MRLAAALGLVLALAVPAVAGAHPLGNFTINHYAGIRVSADAIVLDIVIDQAEIPAFQERLRLDTDDDGDISEAEAEAARGPECELLSGAMRLEVDGGRVPLELTAAGLSFPQGAGGLPTLRLVCGFAAVLDGPIPAGATVRFADGTYAERIGWREIVVEGDRVTLATLDGSDLPATSISQRLTSYPEDLLAQPLDVRSLAWTVVPGGPALAPFVPPDAQPLPGAPVPSGEPTPSGDPAASPTPSAPGAPAAGAGSVPGGVAEEIPVIFQAADLSPVVLLLAILTAAALGAGHALTPGHGKTLMAAYLVGTRGTPLHAAGLGLSVTVSHTLGILVLAALVAGSQQLLPTEAVVRATPVIAAVTIVAIGTWMLTGEIRRRRAQRAAEHAHDHGHGDHDHEHSSDRDHDAQVHTHGGRTHRHLPASGTTIT